MFALGNLLRALATLLELVLTIYMWIIIIRALISWVSPDPHNPVVRFLHSVTDPVLRPIQRRIGFGMGIDFSPIIVILVIIFLQTFLVQTLFDLARRVN